MRDLRDEVLARMHARGADRAHSASELAWHGDRLPTGDVERTLEDLWEEGRVVQARHGRWRLAAAPAGRQMRVGDG